MHELTFRQTDVMIYPSKEVLDLCYFSVCDKGGFCLDVKMLNVTLKNKGDCQRLKNVCEVHNIDLECHWIPSIKTCECSL